MNIIWTILMFLSLTTLIFSAPDLIISTMINESKNVVALCINLIAIYAVWMGILEIVDKTGISEKLAKFLYKPIRKIFRIDDRNQIKYIALNLSANFLGLGNAATPSGIKAIKSMENNLKKTKFAILMLIVVNSTSIQLLPTTAIGLLASAGSNNPSSIIIPTLIATTLSTVFGVFVLLIYDKFKKSKNE